MRKLVDGDRDSVDLAIVFYVYLPPQNVNLDEDAGLQSVINIINTRSLKETQHILRSVFH